MDLVEGIGYVALTVPQLEDSIDFHRRVSHLKVSDKGPGTAFLTGGEQHHWLRLDEGQSTGLARLGFQATDHAALDEVTRRLDARGISWDEIKEIPGDSIRDAIRFKDPDGLELELFVDMSVLPSRPDTFLRMDRLLHGVWFTSSPTDSASFYRDVLGFKDSDWIERFMVFMRGRNGYHHSIGIMGVPPRAGQLDHFCIMVDTIDDVVLARNLAVKRGAELRHDLVRHAASGSISTYINDPISQISVEFCVEHLQIQDPDYRPRVLKACPVTQDMWQREPDPAP